MNKDRNTLPFTPDSLGRNRKIVFTPRKITVELVDSNLLVEADGGSVDVTGALTRDELREVVDLVKEARNREAARSLAETVEGTGAHKPVIVVTDAMVDACYTYPERVPLPGRRLMRETLERALKAANLLVVDLPFLHVHARLAGDYLMKAREHLGHRWTGGMDEALNHIDYVKVALDPFVSAEASNAAEAEPDYKKLFEDAMLHLRIVSGSRNSFTSDATARLFDLDQPSINLRTAEMEGMHKDAHEFIKRHEHLLPQDKAKRRPSGAQ